MPTTLWAVALGFLLDLLLGDPYWLPHPVRWIGRAVSALERALRGVFPKTPRGERAGGTLLGLLIPFGAAAAAWALLALAARFGRWPVFLLETWMCYQLLAVKSLRVESMKVCRALERGDAGAARAAVSMIVGRDTARLSPEGIAKAAVETVAENASDGVAAPLFFLILGGAPFGFFYKAVNTLDSMVGYRNEKYLWFGRFSARLDDLLNYLPSRLCALLMAACAPLCGLSGAGALRIWRRDRRKHKSPNSAQTESACAGALGVRLAGDARYGGVLVEKPTIGDPSRPVEPRDIRRANRLMAVSSAAALVLFTAARLLLGLLLHGLERL